MQDYYRERAPIYERVYHKPERQADLRAMEAWIAGPATSPFAGRRVLEVACGTGWWTPHAARAARRWLATDVNPETMALARAKPLPDCVEFRTVDAFTFEGLDGETFDAAFAGCWWSHLTWQQLPGWIASLHARLEPGARVVFLDNRYVPGSSQALSRTDAQGNGYQQRTLDDGRRYEVVKNFPTPEQAFAQLGTRARDPQWIAHEHYWILDYTLA